MDAAPSSASSFGSRLKSVAGVLAPIAAVGAILGGLAGYLNAWSTFKSAFLAEDRSPVSAPGSIVSKGPTIVVAPFGNETGDAAGQPIANGLTRATIASLSKFDQLHVLGASAQSVGDRTQAKADYRVEGEVLGDARTLRAIVRLVNSTTGAQVWSKNFEEKASDGDVLSAEERIAGSAAAIVGSWQGRIAFDEYPQIVGKTASELTSYECIVLGVMVSQRPLPESVARARNCLEALVVKEPTNADALSALSAVLNLQRVNGLGLPPEESGNVEKRAYLSDKALDAASRAVALAPNRSLARRILGLSYAAKCDRDHLREETRKAIELNPNDPMNFGHLGFAIVNLGDFDEGAALVERGIAMLGSDAPRWWYSAIATHYFAAGDYERAYESALKAYHEGLDQSYLFQAIVLSALGRGDAARNEIGKLMAVKPAYNLQAADALFRSICMSDVRRHRALELLSKAGLPE